MIKDKTNKEILQEYNKYVKGHIQAKKALINLVNRSKLRHYQKWVAMEPKENLIEPMKCLLIGASGTGKTFLVETLQRIVKFPLIKLDATRLTLTSAGDGIKVSEVINMIKSKAKALCSNGKGYYHSQDGIIDQMVVFIDEIDKLAWGAKGESDEWNKRVQSNYLQLLENHDELSGVSFIFAGAFTDLDKVKRVATKALGFNPQKEDESDEEILDDLVVKYGLIPEIVGRINTIIELDKFTEQDYHDILVDTLIPKKMIELAYFNASQHTVNQEDKDKIIKKAFNSGQGVRFLKRELDRLFMEFEFLHEDHLENPLLLNCQ